MSEFPEGSDAPPHLTRRELFMLLGANAALAGATGCSRGKPELIVPYVRQPLEVTPGVPSLYATTMTLGGYGTGLLVESHEGRPTKAEGNPPHPASLGALGHFEQASVLSMYDPARGRELTRNGAPSTWRALLDEVGARPAGRASGIHVLLEPTSSPHLEPLDRTAARPGRRGSLRRAPLPGGGLGRGRLAFGRPSSLAGTSRRPMSCWRSMPTSSRRPARRRPGRARGRHAQDRWPRRRDEPALCRRAPAHDDRHERRRAPASAGARSARRGRRGPRCPGGPGRRAGPGGVRRAGRSRAPGRYDAWAQAVARDLHAHAAPVSFWLATGSRRRCTRSRTLPTSCSATPATR